MCIFDDNGGVFNNISLIGNISIIGVDFTYFDSDVVFLSNFFGISSSIGKTGYIDDDKWHSNLSSSLRYWINGKEVKDGDIVSDANKI